MAPNTVELLDAWRRGERTALDELIPRIEHELRQLARAKLRRERANHSLQSAELVAEVYMRMTKQRKCPENRGVFLAIASQLMRRLLINHARDRRTAKRGGDAQKVTLDEQLAPLAHEVDLGQMIEIDDALAELEALDQRQARVVEMRVFGGMTNGEMAEAIGISTATIKREWTMASAWLRRRLEQYAAATDAPPSAPAPEPP